MSRQARRTICSQTAGKLDLSTPAPVAIDAIPHRACLGWGSPSFVGRCTVNVVAGSSTILANRGAETSLGAVHDAISTAIIIQAHTLFLRGRTDYVV